jgi:hypothetical protein
MVAECRNRWLQHRQTDDSTKDDVGHHSIRITGVVTTAISVKRPHSVGMLYLRQICLTLAAMKVSWCAKRYNSFLWVQFATSWSKSDLFSERCHGPILDARVTPLLQQHTKVWDSLRQMVQNHHSSTSKMRICCQQRQFIVMKLADSGIDCGRAHQII